MRESVRGSVRESVKEKERERQREREREREREEKSLHACTWNLARSLYLHAWALRWLASK